MTKFPSLNDELRPRTKLKKHEDSILTDAAIDANSRQIGQKWGAATTLPVPEPEPTPVARVVSFRGYIPHYLDDELTVRAATQRVTKTFLVMDALKKAGYHVAETDLIQDRRRNKG
jgi:hypothetical protein